MAVVQGEIQPENADVDRLNFPGVHIFKSALSISRTFIEALLLAVVSPVL